MKKFEVGKRYYKDTGDCLPCEIISRTARTITYADIDHEGRYNERRKGQKQVKIRTWTNGEEWFLTPCGYTVIAY